MTYEIKRSVVVGYLCLTALVVISGGLLLRQNAQLRAARYRDILEPRVGTRLPALSGHGPDGAKSVLTYGSRGQKTVLLVFSPTCGTCDENWPKWKNLINGLNKALYRVVAVDLAPRLSRAYVEKHGLDGIQVIADLDPGGVLDYHFRLTPQTILVSSAGEVEKVWTGLLEGNRERDAQKALGVPVAK